MNNKERNELKKEILYLFDLLAEKQSKKKKQGVNPAFLLDDLLTKSNTANNF